MPEAVILDALRTPIGKRNGALKDWRPDDLLGYLLKHFIRRQNFDPLEIEDAIIGCVTQTGEQGLNIGRLAILSGRLPVEIPAVSLNRKCGSSLQAANFAAQAIMAGMQDLVIAGGIESMTRVPMGSSDAPILSDNIRRYHALIPQGISAELIAERWGQTREQLDNFSLRSHMNAAKATRKGYFDREILPIPIKTAESEVLLTKDEGIRYNTSIKKLANLRSAFKLDGIVTAGNSSQISDGAAVVLIASQSKADKLGLKPRAKFVSMALAAVDPTINLTAPMPASIKALKKAKLTIDDMDVIEVNEAFASIPLAFIHDLKPDLTKINPNGGAIALGHPLGCTGTKLLTHLVYELERRNGRYGLATLCIGGGQGIATIIERLT